jgi:hypothetical protein
MKQHGGGEQIAGEPGRVNECNRLLSTVTHLAARLRHGN